MPSIIINRKPDTVFDYVNTPATWPLWMVGTLEVQPVKGDQMELGTKVHYTVSTLGKRMEFTHLVTEFVPPTRLALKCSEGPFKIDYLWTFEAVAEGTRATLQPAAEDASGFFKLAMPMIEGMARRNLEASVGNLKQLLEAQVPVHA